MSSSSGLLLALGLLFAGAASVAQGASYTVAWGFNTTAVFVPELAITCGDSVTFSINANQTHDVTQVVPVVPSLARFPSVCNASVYQTAVPRQTFSAPYNFTQNFTQNGVYYYICSVTSPRNHCSFGKMALKVSVLGDCPALPSPPPPTRSPAPPVPAPPKAASPSPPVPAPPKAASPSPPMARPPPPARIPQTITQRWAFGVASTTPLQAQCGDSVLFRSAGGLHDVIEVDASRCDANQVQPWLDPPRSGAFDVTVPMNRNGLRTFICTVNGHCDAGMLINVNTTGC